jgi:uncharacterized protein YecE (DUF72 family)
VGENKSMNLYVGTSGYSYKEWKGPILSRGFADAQMLRFYGERLRTVEINNTFLPNAQGIVLEDWAATEPNGIQIRAQGPRQITHIKRLKDAAIRWRICSKWRIPWASAWARCSFNCLPFSRRMRPDYVMFLALVPKSTSRCL